MRSLLRHGIILLIIFLVANNFSRAQSPVLDAAKIQLALKKLGVLGSVLYIAAHPDDENTAVLAYCANEKLFRTGYLSITRGDGGQNLIGSEQAELMGVIRTQELLAARRIDGAEQFFTRAIDFGYSKTTGETFEIWGKEKILSDVVWVIRKFRPDVIITRFPGTGEGGHGNHTASAILAEEAFRIAGDPDKFPEQLKFVRPWKPKRILWNAWLPILQERKADLSKYIKCDIGTYNPLLGRSYTELAAESRSMHKSQGFGVSASRGENMNYFELLAGDSARKDLLDNVDVNWSRVKGGEAVGKILTEAYRSFQPENPSAILPLLVKAYGEMNKLSDDYWIPQKKKELSEAICACAGIWMEATAADYSASPGSAIKISAAFLNRSQYPFTVKSISWPFQSSDSLINFNLKNNKLFKSESVVTLPRRLEGGQPYWLKEKPEKGIYSVSDQTLIGLAENESPLNVEFTVLADREPIVFKIPVTYRWNDPLKGELVRPFEITPQLVMNLEEKVYVFSDTLPKAVHLTLKSGLAHVAGELKLNLPEGWKSSPEKISFKLENKNDETALTFRVQSSQANATGTLAVEGIINGEKFTQSVITINYAHIPIQTLFPKAQAKLIRLDIKTTGKNIGYIMGAGDDIPKSLGQLNYHVQLLSDQDLNNADFSPYDAVITGIRAYNTRGRLKQTQKKLMDYVYSGGTLIVQYNNNRGLVVDTIGPYPFKISTDRITVEEAPINFLNKDHVLLNFPNKISQNDFEGWVQERGLYFSNTWDAKYDSVLSGRDPNESPKNGGMLITHYGKGVFIYSAYAWFRQLPAGVPGAYRIFINMISAGKNNP